MGLTKSGERIIPQHFLHSKDAYLLYLRHLFAYECLKAFMSKHTTVLEIGCGEGYGTHSLSSHVKHITGVDLNSRAIEHASQKYESQQCSFTLSDGTTLPFDDRSFDVVISLQVIEHVRDDLAFLQEIRRVLKAEGTCIITTPNGSYRVAPQRPPWNRFHVREYTPETLSEILHTVFSEVHVWGIRGSDEIQALERARVTQAQKFATLIPVRLRHLIPAALEMKVITLLKRLLKKSWRSSQNTRDFLEAYTIHDYDLIKEHVEDSLDLFALCQR